MKIFMKNFSLPFDQHTYIGFISVSILQAINVYTYFIVLIIVTAYFLSICFYVEAICDDFQHVLWSILRKNHDLAQDIKTKQIETIILQVSATT